MTFYKIFLFNAYTDVVYQRFMQTNHIQMYPVCFCLVNSIELLSNAMNSGHDIHYADKINSFLFRKKSFKKMFAKN